MTSTSTQGRIFIWILHFFSRFWRLILISALALITITPAIGVGVVMAYIHGIPPIDELEYFDPPSITRVYDRSGEHPIADFKQERRQFVPISEIPELLKNAFIAIEDRRFYQHYGVDPVGILRVISIFLHTKSFSQGASTITQQTARNLITRVGTERNFDRKLREAIYSVQIEKRYSKDQILEFYLNEIPFGGTVRGVWAAAASYFGKDLSQLTLAECALLAGVPNAPTRYNPRKYPQRALQRRDLVLANMFEQGMITKQDYEIALVEPLQIRDSLGMVSLYPSFLNAMVWDLKNYYGLKEENLRTAGYRITSTVDPAMQEACTEALRNGLIKVEKKILERNSARYAREVKDLGTRPKKSTIRIMKIDAVSQDTIAVSLGSYRGMIPKPEQLPFYDAKAWLKPGQYLDVRINEVNGNKIEGVLAQTAPVQGAIVVLSVKTGEVLAIAGDMDEKLLDWNNAVQGGRQPGSCFKPLVYATAFDRGFQPNDIVVDEPVEYDVGSSKPYRPVNYTIGSYRGPMTLIEAIEKSNNIAVIRLFEAMRPAKAIEELQRFDFTYTDRVCWKLRPELALALGTMDVSPFQLAAGYQALANLGWGVRPQFVRSIVDKDGKVAVPIRKNEMQVISPIAAYQVQYAMRQAVLRGTGKAEIGDQLPSPPYPPICGKTGTTTDNRDAWFSGFTPDLVVIVQVGFRTPRTMGPEMTGGGVAGPIWREAFAAIYKTRQNWNMSFTAPARASLSLMDICAASGKRASYVCTNNSHKIYKDVPFERGKGPTSECTGGPSTAIIAPVGGYRYLSSSRKGFAYSSGGGGGSSSSWSDDDYDNSFDEPGSTKIPDFNLF